MPSPGLGTIRMESDMAAPTPVNRIASSSTTRRRGNRSDQPGRPGGKIREKGPEQIQKTGKNKAEGNLQNIHQQHQPLVGLRMLLPLNGVQNQLNQHKHAVEEHGGVAEVERKIWDTL